MSSASATRLRTSAAARPGARHPGLSEKGDGGPAPTKSRRGRYPGRPRRQCARNPFRNRHPRHGCQSCRWRAREKLLATGRLAMTTQPIVRGGGTPGRRPRPRRRHIGAVVPPPTPGLGGGESPGGSGQIRRTARAVPATPPNQAATAASTRARKPISAPRDTTLVAVTAASCAFCLPCSTTSR